jgi:hypothetical protein
MWIVKKSRVRTAAALFLASAKFDAVCRSSAASSDLQVLTGEICSQDAIRQWGHRRLLLEIKHREHHFLQQHIMEPLEALLLLQVHKPTF